MERPTTSTSFPKVCTSKVHNRELINTTQLCNVKSRVPTTLKRFLCRKETELWTRPIVKHRWKKLWLQDLRRESVKSLFHTDQKRKHRTPSPGGYVSIDLVWAIYYETVGGRKSRTIKYLEGIYSLDELLKLWIKRKKRNNTHQSQDW